MDDARKLVEEIEKGLMDLAKKVRALAGMVGASGQTRNLSFETAQAEIEAETAAPAPAAPAPAPEEQKPSLPAGPLSDLVDGLFALEGVFSEAGLPVDPQDIAFVRKVGTVLAGLPEDERQGEKGGKILFDCLKFLDKLQVNYTLPSYEEAVRRVFDVSCRLLTHLESDRGFEIFPRPLEETTRMVRGRISAYDKAVKENPVFDERPEGTIVGVLQHGAMLKGKPYAPAQILVSTGRGSEFAQICRRIMVMVLREAAKGGEPMFKAAGEIRKLLSRFESGQDEEPITARYVVNVLHENNASGVFKKTIKDLLDHLRKLGYAEIIVGVGKMFDESYSPGKYERRKVSSGEPEGTIVGVIQRGFLDRNGVAVQKAVVAVSAG